MAVNKKKSSAADKQCENPNSVSTGKKSVKEDKKNESKLAEDQTEHSYYYDDSTNYSVYHSESETEEDDF